MCMQPCFKTHFCQIKIIYLFMKIIAFSESTFKIKVLLGRALDFADTSS